MVIGLKGAATALNGATEGALPPWLGALGVVALTGVYTAAGGMRATAWTNVLQGLVFLLFMVACFVLIPRSLGGLGEATEAVRAQAPDLLRVADGPLYTPRAWTSWGLAISLTVIAFPHMFARLMAARDEEAIKSSCRWYPLALVLLWVPAVLLGVWGAAAFPGLEGRASDRIFSLMTSAHLPPWLGPLGAVAVLASVMSTLDAQLLTLSSMLVRDLLSEAGDAARRDVRASRAFGLGLGAVVYVLALTWGQSLFGIAEIAFSGYVTLAPALFLGVAWRRCTAAGALASVVAGNVALGLGAAGLLPTAGFLPVFWAFVCAAVAGVAVSLATRAQGAPALERAFGAPRRHGAEKPATSRGSAASPG
jgi:SSS family solute:Na+ symporter